MENYLRHFLAMSIGAVVCLQTVQAQDYVVPYVVPYAVPDAPQYRLAQEAFTQQELDAMLAPVALYPDALLAQILMAATYPLEVVEAARWSRSIPGVDPQEAVRSVAQRNWDPSVQSLMAFPQVLALMDSQLDWTQRLGNAFLAQQDQVWATVQALRQRAYAAGNLRSGEQVRVLHNGPVIVLEPVNPEVVYLPYYDPLLIYGRWWWPGYAPVRWNPWPGYAARPGVGVGFYAGSGIHVGLGFFFSQVNWNTHRAVVLPPAQRPERHTHPWQPGQEWRHDPQHRRNIPYSNTAVRAQPVPRTAPTANRPELRGHMPNPKVQVEPSAPTPRRPAEPSERRPPGRSGAGPAPGAPVSVTPATAAPDPNPTMRPPHIARPVPRPGDGPVQNAAPGGGERPASARAPGGSRLPAESRAPAESKVAPREPGAMRPDEDRP